MVVSSKLLSELGKFSVFCREVPVRVHELAVLVAAVILMEGGTELDLTVLDGAAAAQRSEGGGGGGGQELSRSRSESETQHER